VEGETISFEQPALQPKEDMRMMMVCFDNGMKRDIDDADIIDLNYF